MTTPTLVGPILLSLGSNIDPIENFNRACEALARRVGLVAVSPIYRSPPVGAQGTPDFCNAALELETTLAPHALKWDVLRAIEQRLGRVRTADRNAPRPIDLDLAVYGDWVLDDRGRADGLGVVVPDPEIVRLLHVARPLADLAPDHVHPVVGRTLEEIAVGVQASSEHALTRCAERLVLPQRMHR